MKILYFFLLIAAAVFYPLFRDDLSFILLVTLLIIPAVLAVLLLVSSGRLRFKLNEKDERTARGEGIKLEVKIKNLSVLPVANCRINVMYRMADSKKTEKYTVGLSLKSKAEELVTVVLVPEHCGVMEYSVKSAEISDFIGLFKRKKKLDMNGSVFVLPRELPCSPATEEIPARKDDAGMINAGRGSDPMEIAALREYADGDRMNRIHWKLSSRTEGLIVKELADNYSGKIMLIADTNACRDNYERDRVLDVFMSLGGFVIKNMGQCSWLSGENDTEVRNLYGMEELEQCIMEIISSPRYGELSLTAAFSEVCSSYVSERFAHIVIITPAEKQAILSEIEHSCCAERITVLCTGKVNSIVENRNSDVVVYYLDNGGRLTIPENFTL